MTTSIKTIITVDATIDAPVEQVWSLWTDPQHIIQWNHASDDWHTPRAENNLHPGGKFLWRMESRDGKLGFDFSGQFTDIVTCKKIEYVLDDGRQVKVSFAACGNTTTVTETFEAEQLNSIELQKNGWQAILDNFKKYAEGFDPGSWH